MKKAVGYIRVSTDEQAREGISMEMQEARIRLYTQAYDLDLIEVISDEGLSAKNLKGRPGVQKALVACYTGAADVLVVYKMDRLARNTMEALDIAEKLNRKGVGLRAVVEHIDTQSAVGRLYFTFGAGIAQFERELTGERTKAALDHKKAHGKVYNHAPYGWDVVDGDLVENQRERETIKTIRDYRAGGNTYQQIAVILTARKIPSKKGGPWSTSSLRKILSRKDPNE